MKTVNFIFIILYFLIASCVGISDEDTTIGQDTTYVEYPEIQLDSIGAAPIYYDSISNSNISKSIRVKDINLNSIISDSSIADYQADKIGDITHIIEDTMKFGITDTVELAISYNTPVNFIIQRVGTFSHTHNDNLTTQKIKITPVMEAKLIDPTNSSFEIIPITDQTQIIEFEDSTYTLWQWRVTPLNGGAKNLILNVNMIVGEHTKSIKIYEDKIYVHITNVDRFWLWIKLNWTYLTYAIGLITALLGFLYKEKILHIFK